jgi:hypothetical protein
MRGNTRARYLNKKMITTGFTICLIYEKRHSMSRITKGTWITKGASEYTEEKSVSQRNIEMICFPFDGAQQSL